MNDYISREEFQEFKQEVTSKLGINLEKITVVEDTLFHLREDTSEIVEWIRHGKLASKVAARSFSAFGHILMWFAKILGAIAVLWAMIVTWKNGGKPPSFQLFP